MADQFDEQAQALWAEGLSAPPRDVLVKMVAAFGRQAYAAGEARGLERAAQEAARHGDGLDAEELAAAIRALRSEPSEGGARGLDPLFSAVREALAVYDAMAKEEHAKHGKRLFGVGYHPWFSAMAGLRRAADARSEPSDGEKAPCGGSRCHKSDAGWWIHSSKSYGTCAEWMKEGV